MYTLLRRPSMPSNIGAACSAAAEARSRSRSVPGPMVTMTPIMPPSRLVSPCCLGDLVTVGRHLAATPSPTVLSGHVETPALAGVSLGGRCVARTRDLLL